MARRLVFGVLFMVAGYFVGGFGGGLLILLFSSNHFDREMEAGMTGAFFTGPLFAIVGLFIGLWRGGRRRPAVPSVERPAS
jgi:hypothetical protein